MGARGRPRLSPRLRLSPTMATTDSATGPTATPLTATATDLSTARERLSPRLRPTLRLSPTTATTDLATMDLATGAMATARGRLRRSLRLRLSPTTTVDTDSATTDLDTGATATVTATDLSTERGRLRPRLTLTTTVDTDLATAMVATVLATGPTGDKLLQSLQD